MRTISISRQKSKNFYLLNLIKEAIVQRSLFHQQLDQLCFRYKLSKVRLFFYLINFLSCYHSFHIPVFDYVYECNCAIYVFLGVCLYLSLCLLKCLVECVFFLYHTDKCPCRFICYGCL